MYVYVCTYVNYVCACMCMDMYICVHVYVLTHLGLNSYHCKGSGFLGLRNCGARTRRFHSGPPVIPAVFALRRDGRCICCCLEQLKGPSRWFYDPGQSSKSQPEGI